MAGYLCNEILLDIFNQLLYSSSLKSATVLRHTCRKWNLLITVAIEDYVEERFKNDLKLIIQTRLPQEVSNYDATLLTASSWSHATPSTFTKSMNITHFNRKNGTTTIPYSFKFDLNLTNSAVCMMMHRQSRKLWGHFKIHLRNINETDKNSTISSNGVVWFDIPYIRRLLDNISHETVSTRVHLLPSVIMSNGRKNNFEKENLPIITCQRSWPVPMDSDEDDRFQYYDDDEDDDDDQKDGPIFTFINIKLSSQILLPLIDALDKRSTKSNRKT
ncbi:hypothetical protein G9A89_020453 [Geosiphon pyriformis]|nr:hypothetical protein G9A89_020453 [Geosiphon pyriformis]